MPWKEIVEVVSEELTRQREKALEDEAAVIAFREILRQEYGAQPEEIARETYKHVDCLMRERKLRTLQREVDSKQLASKDVPH